MIVLKTPYTFIKTAPVYARSLRIYNQYLDRILESTPLR